MIPFGQQEIPPESPHWLIVASQDCDVINGNLEIEPAVELIVATPIDRVHQSNTHLRHPRELHFHMLREDGTEQPVAVNVRGRAFLDRSKLLALHPDESIRVPRHAVAEIAGLLGGRYDRTAFPDAFEKRFRSAKRRLDSTLEHHMAALSEILVDLDPFEELHSESETYDLTVYAVVHDAVADGPSKAYNALKRDVGTSIRKAIRSCRGINLEKVTVCGRDDITLRELEGLRQIDFGSSGL